MRARAMSDVTHRPSVLRGSPAIGINAQGARTKMLKKIDDLAKRNSKTERDLAQFRKVPLRSSPAAARR